MKTYSSLLWVEAKYLDKGKHANWIKQLEIAQEQHFALRENLGLGLEYLKDVHGLFLVIRTVRQQYHDQLRLDDVCEIETTVWVSGYASLEFTCVFFKDKKIVTEMSWIMPLVSMKTDGLVKIPLWMKDAIGPEKPEHQKTASTA